ncbi:unnamed protein product, partial [Allacma fusca]
NPFFGLVRPLRACLQNLAAQSGPLSATIIMLNPHSVSPPVEPPTQGPSQDSPPHDSPNRIRCKRRRNGPHVTLTQPFTVNTTGEVLDRYINIWVNYKIPITLIEAFQGPQQRHINQVTTAYEVEVYLHHTLPPFGANERLLHFHGT